MHVDNSCNTDLTLNTCLRKVAMECMTSIFLEFNRVDIKCLSFTGDGINGKYLHRNSEYLEHTNIT